MAGLTGSHRTHAPAVTTAKEAMALGRASRFLGTSRQVVQSCSRRLRNDECVPFSYCLKLAVQQCHSTNGARSWAQEHCAYAACTPGASTSAIRSICMCQPMSGKAMPTVYDKSAKVWRICRASALLLLCYGYSRVQVCEDGI